MSPSMGDHFIEPLNPKPVTLLTYVPFGYIDP